MDAPNLWIYPLDFIAHTLNSLQAVDHRLRAQLRVHKPRQPYVRGVAVQRVAFACGGLGFFGGWGTGGDSFVAELFRGYTWVEEEWGAGICGGG